MNSDWSLLPPKALRTLFSYISREELVKITCVCKSWYEQIKFGEDFDEENMMELEDGANDIQEEEAENPEEETNQEDPVEESEIIEILDDESESDGEERDVDVAQEIDEYIDIEDEEGEDQENTEDLNADDTEKSNHEVKRQSTGRIMINQLAKTIPRQEYEDDEVKSLVYAGNKYRRLSKKKSSTDEERNKYIQLNKTTRTKLKLLLRIKKKEALIRLGMIEEGDYVETKAKFGVEDPKEPAEASTDLLDPSQIKQEKEDIVSSGKLS